MEALEDPNDLWFSGWATVELIEAASRTGRMTEAKVAFEQLEESTDASGTDWAQGIQARCRALLSEGEEAEGLYREAIDRFLLTRLRPDIGRTRLLYGEWLRRQQRQRDARDQLRRAHELFVEFGMSAFANRAEAELLATGERARKRTVDTQVDLTPQEARISRMAAEGATNQEIAGQLFISTATVEYHLSKVYRKLGIRSRTQLANTLLSSPQSG
jgi:DNA-binding CsgD family transcriptional regulator